MNDSLPTGSAEQAETPTRRSRVVVIQGQSFSVREEPYSRGGVLEPTLVFSSDRVARRVRVYPSDWHALPDDALIQLSWER